MASSISKQSQISAPKNNKITSSFRKYIDLDTSSCSLNSQVPSPPKRKSSRNNRTLKLYSLDPTKLSDKSQNQNTRHEQCFVEEKISNTSHSSKEKLNPNSDKHRKDREELQKKKFARSSSISPTSLSKRSNLGASLSSKNRKSEPNLSPNSYDSEDIILNRTKYRISYSTSPVSRSERFIQEKKCIENKLTGVKASVNSLTHQSSKDLWKTDKVCQHVSRLKTTSCTPKKEHKIRRTKKEQEESCKRLSRPTVDLISPVEVRRIVQRQKEKDKQSKTVPSKILASETIVKNSSPPLLSTLGNNRLKLNDKSVKVTEAITSRGTETLKKSTKAQQSSISQKQKKLITERLSNNKKKKIKDKTLSNQKLESKQGSSDKIKVTRELERSNTFEMKSSSKKNCKDLSNMNAGHYKISEKMTRSEIVTPTLTVDLLRQHQEATMTDSFFQHLFLRDIFLTSSQTNPLRRSSVLDRARIFQEIDYNDGYKSEPSLKSLNIYLSHKRPVSNSRFRNWERESLSSRSSSPFGYRFNKIDSLLKVNEFGSSSSLRGRSPDLTRECPKERSLSEPPLKTVNDNCDIITRRSPTHSSIRSPANRKIQILRQENLNNSTESLFKKSRARSASEVDYIDDFKENFGSNMTLTRSTNSLINFPIDREDYQQYILERLHSRQKSKRYKDLYDFYTSLERIGNLEKSTSNGELRPRLKNEEIIDYERWRQIRTKEKAEEELRDLYKKIQLVQREKDFLFSTRDIDRYKWRGDSSLRCKERSVENIREQFRKLENEESELEMLRQREIASKKDTYKPLWRGNSVVNVANAMARKAAEKADFDSSSLQASLQRSLGGSNKFWSSLTIEQVTALKNQLNDIYGNDPVNPIRKIKPKCSDAFDNAKKVAKPTDSTENDTAEPQKHYKEEIIIQSKQMEKKGKLILDEKKSSASISEFEIIVPKQRKDMSSDSSLGLHVRCHSMIAPDHMKRSDEIDSMKRSGSISRVSSLERSQSDRVPKSPSMSEVEKKRLSLTLGKEMLEKVNQRLSSSMVMPRETRGALAAASIKNMPSLKPRATPTNDRPESEERIVSTKRSDCVVVVRPKEDGTEEEHRVEKVIGKIINEWSENPGGAEGIDQVDSTTESSDTSVRTVVNRSHGRSHERDDVFEKVEVYEKIEKQSKNKESRSPKLPCTPSLSSSQSFTDLKGLFGESSAARYQAIPFYRSRSRSNSPTVKAERAATNRKDNERSTSASPDVVASTRRSLHSCSNIRDRDYPRPRSVSPCRVASPAVFYDSSGSLECLWQGGSSPDPDKYWRAYLKLVRDGSVRRLREKFEGSLEELPRPGPRRLALASKRFQSDPELARDLLRKVTDTTKNYIKPQEIPDVAWLRRKYEPLRGRRRRGGISPIPRTPLRLEDLRMPHINVISKTAELKDSTVRKRSSSESRKEETKELKARRAVNRVREIFERSLVGPEAKTSILGEMFTSAPNVHELRDIAPYLAGRWIAHQYPSRYDNSRSLSSPPDLSRKSGGCAQPPKRSITPPCRKRRPPSSRKTMTLPARPKPPVSILKPSQPQDIFANQAFDPSKHRPRFRYQPPPPPLPLPPSPKRQYGSRASWWPPIRKYSARPTVVTFEGPIAWPETPKSV
jgi:hypothetical protein